MTLSQQKVDCTSRCSGCASEALPSSNKECGGDLICMNTDNDLGLPLWEIYSDRKTRFILLRQTGKSGHACLFFSDSGNTLTMLILEIAHQPTNTPHLSLLSPCFSLMVYLPVSFYGFPPPKPVTSLCTDLSLTQYSGYVFLYSFSSQTAFS